ncbi:MAG: T9SS type A sorting domain-containing protein [Chlorobi bacterium]|nr:T9SS type A sorting domain-containing protein [Chlorobiota bacterium]
MKKLLLLLTVTLFTFFSAKAQILWECNFETAGGYTTAHPEHNDGAYDYFARLTNNDISATYNSPEQSYFFACQDIDADGGVNPDTVFFTGIDISSATQPNLTISFLASEFASGWDDVDFVHFLYSVDGSSYQNLIWFENDGSQYNSAAFEDTDFDGTGDGTQLTNTFAEFSKQIPSGGSSLDIMVVVSLNSGSEDFAFDDVLVYDGTPVVIPEITNIAQIGTSEIGITYNASLSAPDVSNYLLVDGINSITFGSLIANSGNDTIVLSNPSQTISQDVILDTLVDAAVNDTAVFYAGILPVSYTNTANNPDTVMQGYNLTLSGVVTANDNYNQVWIQDSDNPMSGVLIYSSSFDSEVSVGDSIVIAGQKSIYNGLTEIVNPILISSVSGHTPVAANVDAADLSYDKTQDDPAAEPWEGQLVTVNEIIIDSLNSSNYEYYGHDCDGNIICFDDDVDYHYGSGFSLTTGNMYSITGVVTFSYGHYRINPRGTTDAIETSIDLTSVVEEPDNQVPNQTIDATVPVDSLHAIEVFKFKIVDEGSDGLPTKLSQFDLYLGPENTVSFENDEIAGGWFDFGDANNPIQFTGDPDFDTDHFTFYVNPESAVIDNGTEKEVILHLWFDYDLLEDDAVLQVALKSDSHGFVSECATSQFMSVFASDIDGGEITLDKNVSIETIDDNVKIYPNPSNGVFNITADGYNLEVFDITGRKITTRTLNGTASIKLPVSGVYFLKFSDNKGSFTQKVIVK